jgi:hypothetical protein
VEVDDAIVRRSPTFPVGHAIRLRCSTPLIVPPLCSTLQLVSHWSHTAPRPLPWTAPAAIPNTGTPSTSKSSWGLRIGFVAKRGGVCGGGVLQVWYGSGVMPPAGTYAYWCVRRALSLLRFLVVRTRLGAKLWAAGFD